MQAATVQAPAAPAAQAAPAAPVTPEPVTAAPQVPLTVVVRNVDGTTTTLPVPLTKQDVENLRARREELSNQLTSAAGRRRRLAEELQAQPLGAEAARAGIEGRLRVLDVRLAQLESDIASTGQQLSAAPEGLLSTQGLPPGGDMPDNVMTVSVVFTIFVLFPLAFTLARNIWKRGSQMKTVAPLPTDTTDRLERLEQGVEAIAIEIERVSEGQRFVTKLLSDQAPGTKLPAGRVADEIHAGQ